ncbi:centrosomal protein of 112 kDa isoform X2 [Astyanax mexicanus]|uniref:centrosomal protein of 112 kDa isoform X2 n=1 Tax=Astyanax mexicanus TaxID=7994 RepID=UPI0020CAE1A3|nr:centrosomal protein of 112 kDa isoform X2 [Astyanax mexicanus]
MMNSEDSVEDLDSQFDHYLVDMKPFVLKLTHKSERQRCALWIKKLCDPVASGSGLTGRKNRNAYARLLLVMLRRGVLEGPFTHRPEAGSLKTLPTYMSIYFDEPLLARPRGHSSAVLPDWVSSELGHSEDTWTSLPKDSSSPRRRNLFSDKSPSRPFSSSPLKHTEDTLDGRHRKQPVSSLEDSDLEARLNSWNLGIEDPRYLRENPIPLSPIHPKSSLVKSISSTGAEERASALLPNKETEMRSKVLEAKHQEERLKLQQKHDTDVQKILERKNGEIAELKSMYRTKQKEAEEAVRTLEKKVQSLLRESQVIRQSKEKQIVELKKLSDQSADSLKNDWEKKLHATVAQMEQEKFDLQKKHTENIQELLEDTNQRLAKMEAEYSAQAQTTERTVRELEARVKQLSVEVENGNLLRQKVTQEKAELEIHIAAISAELQEANRRSISMLKEKEVQNEQYEETLQKLHNKHEADMNHFQQEHALSAAKASEVIEDLERMVAQLRQQLQDSEHRRQKQLRELENKMHQETKELQHSSEIKVQALQAELEKERADARRRSNKLEDALRDRDEQLSRMRESQRQQVQQAEQTLENFKKQVELSSEKAYTDMKQQMEKVEADLSRSKSLREKQAEEFSFQLEELKQRYEQQTISDLEVQVQALREEVLEVQAQRKQQLSELTVLREEERQRAAQDQDAAVSRVRAEMERVRQDLEKTHTAERERAQEKMNSRLKQLERENSQRVAKSAQAVAELQTALCSVKEESIKNKQALERQLQEAQMRWDEEKRQLNRDSDRASKVLQERVEALQKQLHTAEKKLMTRQLETQEQITLIRQEYELKIKGLMPAELRQELEDTITSLKSQVNFLQKRASVLQEDLDACRNRR